MGESEEQFEMSTKRKVKKGKKKKVKKATVQEE